MREFVCHRVRLASDGMRVVHHDDRRRIADHGGRREDRTSFLLKVLEVMFRDAGKHAEAANADTKLFGQQSGIQATSVRQTKARPFAQRYSLSIRLEASPHLQSSVAARPEIA